MTLGRLWIMGALVLATGCKGPKGAMGLSAEDRALLGTWQDEGGALTTIAPSAGAAAVTGILDTDGERFEVLQSGWSGGHYGWSYRVPSTGYVVEITIQTLDGDRATTTWSNSDQKSGSEELVRISP